MSFRKPDIMIKLEGHDEYALFTFPNQEEWKEKTFNEFSLK